MTQQNKYDWKELKQYLEGFVEAQVERDMSDPDFINDPDINWTADDARVNAVENLKDALTIIFPNELINIDI